MKNLTYKILCVNALLIIGCSGSPELGERVNKKASLPADFKFTGLGLKVMSTLINKNKGTMSTLYGNEIAIRTAKEGAKQQRMVLSLITWKQKPNVYWYGNNIPGQLLSLEMLQADKNTAQISYTRFEGQGLAPAAASADDDRRIDFILNQKPSVLP
jgi:hypothetical protein